MAQFNEWHFIGYLVKDPELRSVSEKSVCDLRVGIPTGDTHLYLTVTVWGAKAQACAEHLAKGSEIFVAGPVEQNSWTDKSGVSHSELKVQARSVQFIGRPLKRQQEETE